MRQQAPEYSTPEDSPRPPAPPGSEALRERSLHLLEYHLVREKLAGYTTFYPAREMAFSLMPSYEPSQVARRQQETTEARRFLETGSAIDLAEAKDLRQALQRAALGGTLAGEELRDLHDTLKSARGARAAIIRQKDMPILGTIAQNMPVLRDLESVLASTIGRSGEVLDSASPTLKELRAESRSAHQHLTDSLERTVRRMQRHGIIQEPVITQRNGRMVLLVKTEMKHRLPGIVHDVSDSGATLFVEPMTAIGLGNRWREMRLAEEREEERVVRVLSAKVETHSSAILRGLELLADLDMSMAKARFSLAINATASNVIEGEHQYISLTDARHPLLKGEIVPITLKIGDPSSLLLITGPNAGGKTVALKAIGLLTLMAQSGLHLPAREATTSLFDGVYADIGDQQSIQQSLSTFSSHIKNLRDIMDQATDRSLVLIDELGTSTDPEEGSALAKAILHHFSQRGITLVATTHQRDVAAFVQEQPGMTNASVELDPHTLAPTYRLTQGLPGRSYALTIASRLGLENETVEHARSLLSPAHQGSESLLRELQEERHLAQETRREAEEAMSQAQQERAKMEEQLADIQNRKAELMEEAQHQLQQKVEEVTGRLRRAERALEQPISLPQPTQPAPKSIIKEARKNVAEVRRELRSPNWQPPPSSRSDWLERLQSGDRVYLRGIPKPVEIVTPPDDGGTVEVILGTMRARLPVYQIDRPAPAHTTPTHEGIYFSRPAKRQVNTELDLHGVRVEEALERIDSFLNDATLAGLSSVRIMHGVGTGALRNASREYLSHHPLVKSVRRDESITNDSATVVELA